MNGNCALFLGVAACVLVGGVAVEGLRAQSGAPAPGATPAAPKMAEEQFKNIKVLKGVPAEQVFPAMQFITTSLGVECAFCHVQGADGKLEFDKDDKKNKQTARKMMEMMFAINKENFDGHRDVTCYSCHRGNVEPVGTPLVTTADAGKIAPAEAKKGEAGEPKDVAKGAANDATGRSADQLLDKYVQALGGAAAVEKVTSRVMKGTIAFGDKSFPIDLYSKDPYKRISFTHMPEGDNVTAFDGRDGWLGTVGHPMREMHGADIDGASIDADLHLATHLRRIFSKVSTRGTEKVGDRDTYVVVGLREGKPPLRLYFDQQSGLLLRLVRFAETPLGSLPTQIDYADYREADGVKVPFRWTLARPNGRFTIQITELKQNVPVDEAKFAKPPAPPQAVPAAPQGLNVQAK
ncbi:MAG TPA: c-type cytochrome [Candidatus Sulfotelmatobacter sp.]|nr:c-type cytochrome [Candidatus Sulfotelmatobacter sp.]